MAFNVSGRAFVDASNPGEVGPGDIPATGQTVYVDLNDNNQFDAGEISTLVDTNGDWTLSGLGAESLGKDVRTIASTLPTGPEEYAIGDVEEDLSGFDFLSDLPAPSQEPTPGSFGITGRVYDDHDGDGAFDVGEGFLEGAQVYLDSNGNDQFDVGEASAVSGPGGLFSLLAPTVDSGAALRVAGPNGEVGSGSGEFEYTGAPFGDQTVAVYATGGEDPGGCDLDLVRVKSFHKPWFDATFTKAVYELTLSETDIDGMSARDWQLDLDLGDENSEFVFGFVRGLGRGAQFDADTGTFHSTGRKRSELEAGDTIKIVVGVEGNDFDAEDVSCDFADLDGGGGGSCGDHFDLG